MIKTPHFLPKKNLGRSGSTNPPPTADGVAEEILRRP